MQSTNQNYTNINITAMYRGYSIDTLLFCHSIYISFTTASHALQGSQFSENWVQLEEENINGHKYDLH